MPQINGERRRNGVYAAKGEKPSGNGQQEDEELGRPETSVATQFDRHGDVFRAVVVITQLSIENGEPLFQCGYCDPPYGREDEDNEMSDGSEFASDQDSTEDDDLSYDTE